MFSFFKKTDEAIRLKSYNDGFKECERIMRNEINVLRSDFNAERAKIGAEHEKHLKEAQKNIEISLGRKIAEQFSEITDLRTQLSRSRKGWQMFQDFIPKVMDIAHTVKTQAESDLDKASIRFSNRDSVLYNIEHIGLRIERLKPKIENLIGNDEYEIIKNNDEEIK